MPSTLSSEPAGSAEGNLAVSDDVVQGAVVDWGRSHRVDYPWRDPLVPIWHKLIAEVMLLRTRAPQVVPVWEWFVERFPSTEDLKGASPADIETMANRLGLRWRAGLIQELMCHLSEVGDRLPLVQDELMQLPGVGDYCAAALLSLHAGRRAVIIDSNVVRVLARLVGRPFDGETRRKGWLRSLATRLTPALEHQNYNNGLLDIAMTVCVRKPRCFECPLLFGCVTGQANTTKPA